MKEKSAMEALLTRRSVRAFTAEPVSEADVRAIIRAGMYAPSAHNSRTWRMITVTDRKKLDTLAPLSKWWHMLYEAPLCIVCCSHSPERPGEEEYLAENAVAATENMLIAIESLNLGGVWLGIGPGRPQYQQVKELFGIPDDVRVVSLIAVGHPKEPLPARAQPQERLEEEKWHKENW